MSTKQLSTSLPDSVGRPTILDKHGSKEFCSHIISGVHLRSFTMWKVSGNKYMEKIVCKTCCNTLDWTGWSRD